MEAVGTEHAQDCPCCATPDFLPPGDGEEAPECEEVEGEEEVEAEQATTMLTNTIFASFDAHVVAIEEARAKRQELLSFKSALEDKGGADVNAESSLDERDGLGVRLPGEEMQGDVNMRTLEKLLIRVDQRGFERSSQQLEFHVAFLKAAARVIYRGSWETEKPAIMRKYGWETSNSEVLISTPRRFGKTFRYACPNSVSFP